MLKMWLTIALQVSVVVPDALMTSKSSTNNLTKTSEM